MEDFLAAFTTFRNCDLVVIGGDIEQLVETPFPESSSSAE